MWTREREGHRPASVKGLGKVGLERHFYTFFKRFNSNITFHVKSSLPEENRRSRHNFHWQCASPSVLTLVPGTLSVDLALALATGVQAPGSPQPPQHVLRAASSPNRCLLNKCDQNCLNGFSMGKTYSLYPFKMLKHVYHMALQLLHPLSYSQESLEM